MKLLLDMNLPPRLAIQLREVGFEAIHCFCIGAPDATDETILSYAQDNDFIMVTCDLDFSAILAVTHGKKPSIIQLRLQSIRLDRDTPAIVSAIKQCAAELDEGAILTIDTKRLRLRLLPLICTN